ncbi:unnamed protein product, partial [Urochloa humidicola]
WRARGGGAVAGCVVAVVLLRRARGPAAAVAWCRWEHWVDEVLWRRFLRLGLALLLKRTEREACSSFAVFSHQAVDFISVTPFIFT